MLSDQFTKKKNVFPLFIFQMKRKLDHGPEVRPFPSGKKPCKGPEYSRYGLRFFNVSTMRHTFPSKWKRLFNQVPLLLLLLQHLAFCSPICHIYTNWAWHEKKSEVSHDVDVSCMCPPTVGRFTLYCMQPRVPNVFPYAASLMHVLACAYIKISVQGSHLKLNAAM